jgi:hypothetical protein
MSSLIIQCLNALVGEVSDSVTVLDGTSGKKLNIDLTEDLGHVQTSLLSASNLTIRNVI